MSLCGQLQKARLLPRAARQENKDAPCDAGHDAGHGNTQRQGSERKAMKTAIVDQPYPLRRFKAAMKEVFAVTKEEILERERKYKEERGKRKKP